MSQKKFERAFFEVMCAVKHKSARNKAKPGHFRAL